MKETLLKLENVSEEEQSIIRQLYIAGKSVDNIANEVMVWGGKNTIKKVIKFFNEDHDPFKKRLNKLSKEVMQNIKSHNPQINIKTFEEAKALYMNGLNCEDISRKFHFPGNTLRKRARKENWESQRKSHFEALAGDITKSYRDICNEIYIKSYRNNHYSKLLLNNARLRIIGSTLCELGLISENDIWKF